MELRDIKTIAVVGAGQMGRGIAQVCATAGYRVLVVDLNERLSTDAVSKIAASLDRAVERGILTRSRREEALSLIQPAPKMDRLREAQLVIEAIPEDLALKQTLFGELHRR